MAFGLPSVQTGFVSTSWYFVAIVVASQLANHAGEMQIYNLEPTKHKGKQSNRQALDYVQWDATLLFDLSTQAQGTLFDHLMGCTSQQAEYTAPQPIT